MKKLFLDCSMGAAGDMLTAALLELTEDPENTAAELNRLSIPGVTYIAEPAEKCGITGTHMKVLVGGAEEHEHSHEHSRAGTHEHTHSHDHIHSGMDSIRHWVSHMDASEAVRTAVIQIYESIASAESKVHGVPVDQIHFHEVGSLDALADVAAVCFLMEKLGNPTVYCSPVHVGSGHVSCAHGILPVPAPATSELLKGIPIYGGQIQGELCTPTGAALLKHFVTHFGDMPVMVPQKIGYGMGRKNFPIANCVRAMMGSDSENCDTILTLSCNLDDMTAEDIGFAMDWLLAGGASDVYTQPIGMKKNRPGVMLTVLCREELRDTMTELLFRYTTTLGVRESLQQRHILKRWEEKIDTAVGTIRFKCAEGFGVNRRKPEYDDLQEAAKHLGISTLEARELLKTSKEG